MKYLIPCFLAVGLLALSAAPLAPAKIVRVVEKSFAVESGGTLKVKTTGGSIRVTIGDSNTVHVVARQRINARTESKADDLLRHLKLTMEKTRDGVELVAKYEGKKGFNFRSWPPVQVGFEVMVPRSYHADLRTSGGDIEVGDLGGELRASTSGGDIDLARIAGDVHASTSGGDIRLKAAKADVVLHTSGGDIEVGQIGGTADLSTSGGDIVIDGVASALQAETSGGSISAMIRGPLSQDCKLATSGGDVRVKMDPKIGFHLDASTSGGDVDASGFAIEIARGGLGRNRLSGDVNGGGPVLKLRTSGGSIDVHAL